jgi:putative transcriptional regulator
MMRFRLKELLTEKGRSLYWLQQATGAHHASLWNLQSGKAKSISFELLEKICRALEVPAGELFVEQEVKTKKGKQS